MERVVPQERMSMQQLSNFSSALHLGNEVIAIDPSSFYGFQQLAVTYSDGLSGNALNRSHGSLRSH